MNISSTIKPGNLWTNKKEVSLRRYSSKPETHFNIKISFYTSQKTPCTYITNSSLLMFFGKKKNATCSVYHMHLINTILQAVKISYFYGYAGMQTVSGRPSCNPYSPQ
jgi:hypothetical protein